MTLLGVNIDHIATLRQQRQEGDPNIIEAAKWAIKGGADNITIHLREDRRHIQDEDVFKLKPIVNQMNFECATSNDIIDIALEIKPEWTCIVPEKRSELTTEGGLNFSGSLSKLQNIITQLQKKDINVSLFINPNKDDVKTAHDLGANGIEIHTGIYSLATNKINPLDKIKQCALYGKSLNMKVQAGHGLNYTNIINIASIPEIVEVNIGHSIICRAIHIGLENAVKEMKILLIKN